MAKVIKSITVSLESESESTTFSTCRVSYAVAAAEDSSLSKNSELILNLTGGDLTAAQDLLAVAVAAAEGVEGI